MRSTTVPGLLIVSERDLLSLVPFGTPVFEASGHPPARTLGPAFPVGLAARAEVGVTGFGAGVGVRLAVALPDADAVAAPVPAAVGARAPAGAVGSERASRFTRA
jgi:hypothetical protein